MIRTPAQRTAAALLTTLTLLLPASAAHAQRLERLFYLTDQEDSFEAFRANARSISIVGPAAFSVDADGVVWGEVDARVIRIARDNGVAVVPLIKNPGFNQELLHDLLENEGARRRAIDWMVELCRRNDFAGIQFDFENVSIRDRDAYTRFYRETAEALHAAGRTISMAVVHRPDELPGPTQYHKWLFENWRAGYDLKAIGEIGDFVSVMTYSQHTRRTPPGPNAGIPWMEDVIAYFLKFIPAARLSLGVPTGSQHWYTSQEDRIEPERARSYSESIDYSRAMALAARNDATTIWNDKQQVAFAFFERGGTFEWIFFEDARSFRAKLDLARKNRLRGISVWALGIEDPAIWPALGSR